MHTRRFSSRILLLADGSGIFGGWIDFVVILTVAAYAYNLGPWGMAWLGAVSLVPGIVLSSWIGRWAESPRALVMLRWLLLVRGIVTLGLIVAPGAFVFISLVVIKAIANSFAVPAVMTISARNVPSQQRTRYYSLLKIINSLSKITAPALGGALAAGVGGNAAFYLSALLCFISLALFCYLKEPSRPAIEDDQAAVAAQGGDAIPNKSEAPARAYPVSPSERATWYAYAGTMLVFCLVTMPMNNQLPILLKGGTLGPGALGYLMASSGSGSLLYALYKARYSNASREAGFTLGDMLLPGALALSLFCVMGGCFGLMANPLVALCVTFFASGLLTSKFLIATNLFMAERMADYLGYATSRIQAIQNTAILVAPFYGAWMLGFLNTAEVFCVLGGFGVIGILLVYLLLNKKISHPQEDHLSDPAG